MKCNRNLLLFLLFSVIYICRRLFSLLQDFCVGAWAYSMWLLVKRVWLSGVLNSFDGYFNAILSLAIQFMDTGLMLFMRPHSNRKVEITELFGSVTNLLVFVILLYWIDQRARTTRYIQDMTLRDA